MQQCMAVRAYLILHAPQQNMFGWRVGSSIGKAVESQQAADSSSALPQGHRGSARAHRGIHNEQGGTLCKQLSPDPPWVHRPLVENVTVQAAPAGTPSAGTAQLVGSQRVHEHLLQTG